MHTDSVALWQTHDSHWGDEYALEFIHVKAATPSVNQRQDRGILATLLYRCPSLLLRNSGTTKSFPECLGSS